MRGMGFSTFRPTVCNRTEVLLPFGNPALRHPIGSHVAESAGLEPTSPCPDRRRGVFCLLNYNSRSALAIPNVRHTHGIEGSHASLANWEGIEPSSTASEAVMLPVTPPVYDPPPWGGMVERLGYRRAHRRPEAHLFSLTTAPHTDVDYTCHPAWVCCRFAPPPRGLAPLAEPTAVMPSRLYFCGAGGNRTRVWNGLSESFLHACPRFSAFPPCHGRH